MLNQNQKVKKKVPVENGTSEPATPKATPKLESVKVTDDDAATLAHAEAEVTQALALLGRERERFLVTEQQLVQQLAQARTGQQNLLSTIGKKYGLKKIGTPNAAYNYDAPTQTYTRVQ